MSLNFFFAIRQTVLAGSPALTAIALYDDNLLSVSIISRNFLIEKSVTYWRIWKGKLIYWDGRYVEGGGHAVTVRVQGAGWRDLDTKWENKC